MSSSAKTIAYVVSAVMILASLPICAISFLFVWGAFSPEGNSNWIPVGVVGLIIGIGLIAAGIGVIVWAGQRVAAGATQNVTLKVDLPGNVKVDSLKCKACGGALSTDNIKMVAGAPMVDCPYCHTTYQLTEEPKW